MIKLWSQIYLDDNKDGISLEDSNFQFSSVDMKEVDEVSFWVFYFLLKDPF